MRISTGRGETIKNRGGSMSYPGLYMPKRHGHHGNGPKKSRSQIMNLRRVRSYMRTGDRKKRKISSGLVGFVVIFAVILCMVIFYLAWFGAF